MKRPASQKIASTSVDLVALAECVEQFSSKTIVLLGDFVAGWAHTVAQQVLRVDYEPQSPLPDAIRKKLQKRLSAKLRHAHALAVSDYGFGVATPELVQRGTAKRKSALHVTLDARYQLQ